MGDEIKPSQKHPTILTAEELSIAELKRIKRMKRFGFPVVSSVGATEASNGIVGSSVQPSSAIISQGSLVVDGIAGPDLSKLNLSNPGGANIKKGCHACGQAGHFKRDCTARRSGSSIHVDTSTAVNMPDVNSKPKILSVITAATESGRVVQLSSNNTRTKPHLNKASSAEERAARFGGIPSTKGAYSQNSPVSIIDGTRGQPAPSSLLPRRDEPQPKTAISESAAPWLELQREREQLLQSTSHSFMPSSTVCAISTTTPTTALWEALPQRPLKQRLRWSCNSSIPGHRRADGADSCVFSAALECESLAMDILENTVEDPGVDLCGRLDVKMKTDPINWRLTSEAATAASAVAGVVEIDGSTLEGGGQVLRSSFALAAVLRLPLRVRSIRAGRPKPGLAAQHLAGLELVSELSGRGLRGASKGSVEVCFDSESATQCAVPLAPSLRASTPSMLVCDPGTAGATTLLAQVALPYLVFGAEFPAASEASYAGSMLSGYRAVLLRGGTNVPSSPPVDFLAMVLVPLLNRMGAGVIVRSREGGAEVADADKAGVGVEELKNRRGLLLRRGFNPEGGGEFCLAVRRSTSQSDGAGSRFLHPLVLSEPGKVVHVRAIIAGSAAASRGAMDAAAVETGTLLRSRFPDISVEVEVESKEGGGGSGGSCSMSVFILARTSTDCLLSGSAILGEDDSSGSGAGETRGGRRRRAGGNREAQADAAARDLAHRAFDRLAAAVEDGVTVDEHTADQLLLYCAMARGVSCLRIPLPARRSSLHIATELHFVSFFTGVRFHSEECPPGLDSKFGYAIISCDGIGFPIQCDFSRSFDSV